MTAINNAVVHLTMRFGQRVLSVGTGVLYERDKHLFIVTAWHNVTGLHSETLEHLDDDKAVPDNLVANICVTWPGFGSQRLPVVIPLADDDRATFLIHPGNWPRVDVVAIPLDLSATYDLNLEASDGQRFQTSICLGTLFVSGVKADIRPLQRCLGPTDLGKKWLDSVDVTEELFIPGYPRNIQDDFGQPVWKRATIASSVQQGLDRQPKFLIDGSTHSGMSGSPVLHYSPSGRVRIRGMAYQHGTAFALFAGIYVGRVGVREGIDPQIGTVWKATVVDEIIDGIRYEHLPFAIEVREDALDEAVHQALSTCSPEGLANVLNEALPSRYFVQAKVMEVLAGRCAPQRALRAVLALANERRG